MFQEGFEKVGANDSTTSAKTTNSVTKCWEDYADDSELLQMDMGGIANTSDANTCKIDDLGLYGILASFFSFFTFLTFSQARR